MKIFVHSREQTTQYPNTILKFANSLIPIVREIESDTSSDEPTDASDEVILMAILEVYGEFFYDQLVKEIPLSFPKDFDVFADKLRLCIAAIYLFHLHLLGFATYSRSKSGELLFSKC